MSGTGARENHSTMTTVNGLGGFLSSPLFPLSLQLPCHWRNVPFIFRCVFTCMRLWKSGQRRPLLTTAHNQPLNGQLLTHLTQTHTHTHSSLQRSSSHIQTRPANQHALPQPQKSQWSAGAWWEICESKCPSPRRCLANLHSSPPSTHPPALHSRVSQGWYLSG